MIDSFESEKCLGADNISLGAVSEMLLLSLSLWLGCFENGVFHFIIQTGIVVFYYHFPVHLYIICILLLTCEVHEVIISYIDSPSSELAVFVNSTLFV